MEKAIRQLTCNSIGLRAWTTLLNHVAGYSSSKNCKRGIPCFLDASQELADSDRIPEKRIIPNLYNEIVNVKSKQQYYENMNTKESIQILKNIKQMSKGKVTEIVRDSVDLFKLCQKIHRDLRSFSKGELILALDVLHLLHVPLDNKLCQMILQVLKHFLNDLSLGQIYYLYYMLRSHMHIPLCASLIQALPLVFRIKVFSELDRQDMDALVKALAFACKTDDRNIIAYITGIYCKNLNFVNERSAFVIFKSLKNLQNMPNSYVQLVSKVYDIIANQKDFEHTEILFIWDTIVYKLSQGRMHFYNENVINKLYTSFTNKDMNYFCGISILRRFNLMRHSHIPLLDYLAVEFIKDNDLLLESGCIDVHPFIRALNIADYKTRPWKIVETKLLDHIMDSNYPIYVLADIAHSLYSLGCYCPELFNKTLTLYYDSNVDLQRERIITWNLLRLQQGLQYLHPEYNGVTLDFHTITNMIKVLNEFDFLNAPVLHEILAKIFRDNKCIKVNLQTKLGHTIACTIALQSDGSPLDISKYNDVQFVEDIILPPDCYKLLICIIPQEAYSINLHTMQSKWKLMLNAIEVSTGANVLPLNICILEKLSDNQKTTYLQQAVELKCTKIKHCKNN